jgi:hypothetical protein
VDPKQYQKGEALKSRAKKSRLAGRSIATVVEGKELSVVAQFEPVLFLRGVIPKPGAVQPGEGPPIDRRMHAGDPSLHLKSGSAQDDATKGNSN